MTPIGDPIAPWAFDVGSPIVWAVIALVCIRQAKRDGALSFTALVLISGTSMHWQEWYGDWGAYLLYNPEFWLFDWGATQWTTPNKPAAVLFAYGWYYAAVFPAILAAVAWLRRRLPHWSRLATLVAVATPLFYVWDLIVEASAVLLGWWSYTDVIGPAIESSKGNFPLAWPILLFTFYGVIASWIMDQRDDEGRFKIEVLAQVVDIRPGWRRETARALFWIVWMNAAYWIFLIGPLIAFRELFGDPSSIVP